MNKKTRAPFTAFQAYLGTLAIDSVTAYIYVSALRRLTDKHPLSNLGAITQAMLGDHLVSLTPSGRPAFRAAWNHLRHFAGSSGRKLVECTVASSNRDSWKNIYPVYWEHLGPLLKLASMTPREAYSLTVGSLHVTESVFAFRVYHPRGRNFGPLRSAPRGPAEPHMHAMSKWGHPEGFLDAEEPLFPDRPNSSAPLAMEKMRTILNGSQRERDAKGRRGHVEKLKAGQLREDGSNGVTVEGNSGVEEPDA